MRTVAIGIQDFGDLIRKKYFYIDKTSFIKEWWDGGDSVTLITRPRRFGKTLNMSMVEYFFSNKHAGEGELFEGLKIWEQEEYRKIQGTYPVISLSFANIKETQFEKTKQQIYQLIVTLYNQNNFLLNSGLLVENEKKFFQSVSMDMSDVTACIAIHKLSDFLFRYYGKKVIILLDEYDTPMQEAYVNGYWEELVAFTRSMFNSTFKTNPWLERAIMTGITRVSKESIFSDLNHLEVVTTTSDKYADSFGFTEEEVFYALDYFQIGEEKAEVKKWYDGFVFGSYTDIYNPWSILNYLDKRKFNTYWANTSANSLVGKLLREGNRKIKVSFERLLRGETIRCSINEQIVYNQLDDNESAVYSMLVASGYLKILDYEKIELLEFVRDPLYDLALTNQEVKLMFFSMVRGWFKKAEADYNDFVTALLQGDVKAMNAYMNRVALQTFSYFDTGRNPSWSEPERFYHGFVLGLLVELNTKYMITSNRESGFGRYDVMLEPLDKQEKAFILEFKVHDEEDETSLKDTVEAALQQIEQKQYAAELIARGISEHNIYRYGFAFQGKKVLIGTV